MHPPPNSGIQPLVTYQGHKDTVVGVHWSNDGQTITSIDQNSTQIWNTNTATAITTYAFSYPSIAASDFAWSPDGTQIATLNDQAVSIWQLATGQNVLSYRKHTSKVDLVAWSPDGKYIASATSDGKVYVWESATGNDITEYVKDSTSLQVPAISSLAWSPDSATLVSSSSNADVNIWDASNGQTIQNFAAYQLNIVQSAWSPDGKQIAWRDIEGLIQVWAMQSDIRALSVKAADSGFARQLVWSPDTRYLVTTSDNIIYVVDMNTYNIVVDYHGHTDNVYAVEWSPDGKYIASAGQDKIVQIWQPFSA